MLISILVAILLINTVTCPPVAPGKANDDQNPENHDPLLNLEYHRYLREVVNILETDANFKKIVENASVDDIKNGNIAGHLDLLNFTLRTKLDELKRREIDRLSQLISRKIKLNSLNGKDIESIMPQHIDHSNMNSFDKSDLEKLIRQASADLDQIDKLRRAEFKEHELEKEFERRKDLEKLDELHRKKAEEEHQKELEQRKHHKKLNHPGSKDQLEEVWSEDDKLEPDTFDPNTFFNLHDLNGDNFLNEIEIEALFQRELDKLYNTSDPNYDPVEREEEANRMREHVMKEIDRDGDKIISREEFVKGTETKDFDANEEWKTLEDEPQYNEEELKEFVKTHEGDANHHENAQTTPAVPPRHQ